MVIYRHEKYLTCNFPDMSSITALYFIFTLRPLGTAELQRDRNGRMKVVAFTMQWF
jgi:hypothetical protein